MSDILTAATLSLTNRARKDGVHFVFRIDEIRDTPDRETGLNKQARVAEGITYKWWYCDSNIRQIEEVPIGWTPFDACSTYYEREIGYCTAEGDATTWPTDETNENWLPLRFHHHNEDFSSSLSIDPSHHPTLRCQRANSIWPHMLLPTINHGPLTANEQYGGLKGRLSIFLALMALSIEPDKLQETMPNLRKNGRWRFPTYQNERLQSRGVVVYVYCGTDSGSRRETLQAYEDGMYGNYFD
ncbi:uncharacterized protein ALTATR162_LOCUS11824 [Alternaria atra]|uniref:Uncharacterized protein n=1 Tax=Alternaria atra TaxID=119953 RepID=A0A8J2IBQ6_9PLEO|nr:uncharacterized protein ALTATR162_LOCUS11824 [Alternaria atra]CAG5187929.1 unnamed protein product [Alternaria atra]